MTYSPTKLLTFEQFLTQYGDDSRYELADGELIDMEPTFIPLPHLTTAIRRRSPSAKILVTAIADRALATEKICCSLVNPSTRTEKRLIWFHPPR